MMALSTNTPNAPLVHSAGVVASAFNTFCRARADWEPNKEADEGDALFDAYANGLDRYLLSPATTPVDLALKLRVIDGEQIWQGWHRGPEIFAMLAQDAQSIVLKRGDRMIDRFIRLPELIERTGLSRRTLYRKMSCGEFPQSVKLGTNAVAWRESDIEAWMTAPMEWRSLEHKDEKQ